MSDDEKIAKALALIRQNPERESRPQAERERAPDWQSRIQSLRQDRSSDWGGGNWKGGSFGGHNWSGGRDR